MGREIRTTISEDSFSTDRITISGSCTLQNSEILANLAMKLKIVKTTLVCQSLSGSKFDLLKGY